MDRRLVVALCLALSACAPTPSTTPTKRATASATPAPTATPAVVAATLQRPPGEVTVVKGSVSVDGFYLRQALGKAVAFGGPDGRSLIISDNGSGVLANNGGNIISNNGGTWRLLEAPTLKQGDLAAVGGMALRVVDPVNGAVQPLGVDAAGKPVREVLTDASGRFEVYLTAKLSGSTMRVTSRVPGASDVRLAYDVYPAAGATQVTVDEDGALLGRLLRTAFSSRLQRLVAAATTKGSYAEVLMPGLPPEMAPLVADFGAKMDQATREGHAETWTADQRRQVADAASDVLLGRCDLEGVKAKAGGQPALADMRAVMLDVRTHAASAMQAGKDLNAEPYLVAANRAPDTASPYRIERPSDLMDFAREYILASPDQARQELLVDIFGSVGAEAGTFDRLNDDMNGFLYALFALFMGNQVAQDEALAIVRAGPTK